MADKTPQPAAVKRTGDFPPVGPPDARPTVLVLDDDPEICDVVAEVLTDDGFDVVCVSDGALGLEHLELNPRPAAILLDLMMPKLNGWTFADRVRAVPQLRDIPIIVMTAVGPHWGYPDTRVLRKPVDKAQLIATVREVVHNNQRNELDTDQSSTMR